MERASLEIKGKIRKENQNGFYRTKKRLQQQLLIMLLPTTIAKYKVQTERIIDFPNKSNYTISSMEEGQRGRTNTSELTLKQVNQQPV